MDMGERIFKMKRFFECSVTSCAYSAPLAAVCVMRPIRRAPRFVILALIYLFLCVLPVANASAENRASRFFPDGLEIPVCPDDSADHEERVLTGFTLCYREGYEQAEWVAYTITPEKLIKVAKRTDKFLPDPEISTGSATPEDYKGSGYDRGHLAPAADMAYSADTMWESFFMSNMSPQEPAFNRGIWNNLENYVRTVAGKCDCLYIVTGPVLEKPAPSYAAIGKSRVSVPEYYYKVMLAVMYDDLMSAATVSAYAYILANEESDARLKTFQCSIDSVEMRTGIDFFSQLDDRLEELLEKGIGTSVGVR